MDEIRELIEKAIDKLKADDNLMENFKKEMTDSKPHILFETF